MHVRLRRRAQRPLQFRTHPQVRTWMLHVASPWTGAIPAKALCIALAGVACSSSIISSATGSAQTLVEMRCGNDF